MPRKHQQSPEPHRILTSKERENRARFFHAEGLVSNMDYIRSVCNLARSLEEVGMLSIADAEALPEWRERNHDTIPETMLGHVPISELSNSRLYEVYSHSGRVALELAMMFPAPQLNQLQDALAS